MQFQTPKRRAQRISLLIAATLSLAPMAASADPAPELPQRRTGVWHISTISPEVGLQANDVCIEPGDSLIGALAEGCDKPVVESAGDQWIVTISCGVGGGREVTSLLFTGDFTSWYRAQAKRTVTRPNGKVMQGTGFTLDAKYLGPSCPKQ